VTEQYVRPPLLATEPVSPAVARWRFRLVAMLLLALLTLVFVVIFLKVSGVTAEDPGLGVGLGRVTGTAAER
jgi:hypothetical protein